MPTWNPKQLSDALAEVVETAGRSLVRIDARRRFGTTGLAFREDGHLLAAAHALSREGPVGVTLPDGSETEAKLVGVDEGTDLAVLKVDRPLTPPRWADATALKVGQLALALARPGKTVRARLGILSVVGEGIDTAWGGRISPYLETDLGVHPGFSGGLLVDVEGNGLGLNTSGLLRGTTVTLAGATLAKLAEPLIAHGKIRRGYLGVGLHPVRLPEAARATAGSSAGLVVLAVEAGGPADRAGLMMGDTLVQLDGAPVEDLPGLWARLGAEKIGTQVQLRVLRAGRPEAIALTVGERP